MSYAEGTTVSVERSKAELDALLSKHGASQRLIGGDDVAGIAFVVFSFPVRVDALHGATTPRQVRLQVPLPKRDAEAFTTRPARANARDPRPVRLDAASAAKNWERACRERWRAIVLLVKAKLEAIAIGVSNLEREFLADITLPDGRSVYTLLQSQIAESYRTGGMPPLLGAASSQPGNLPDHDCG